MGAILGCTVGRWEIGAKVMNPFPSYRAFRWIQVFAVLSLLSCVPAFCQQTAFVGPNLSAVEFTPTTRPESVSFSEPPAHSFWDRENSTLFASVAASSTADFAVTYSNLRDGGKELNPVTRLFSGTTAGLALNFVGETAGVIAISYLFHETGHHKLERIASIVDASASAAAVSYGLMHR